MVLGKCKEELNELRKKELMKEELIGKKAIAIFVDNGAEYECGRYSLRILKGCIGNVEGERLIFKNASKDNGREILRLSNMDKCLFFDVDDIEKLLIKLFIERKDIDITFGGSVDSSVNVLNLLMDYDLAWIMKDREYMQSRCKILKGEVLQRFLYRHVKMVAPCVYDEFESSISRCITKLLDGGYKGKEEEEWIEATINRFLNSLSNKDKEIYKLSRDRLLYELGQRDFDMRTASVRMKEYMMGKAERYETIYGISKNMRYREEFYNEKVAKEKECIRKGDFLFKFTPGYGVGSVNIAGTDGDGNIVMNGSMSSYDRMQKIPMSKYLKDGYYGSNECQILIKDIIEDAELYLKKPIDKTTRSLYKIKKFLKRD